MRLGQLLRQPVLGDVGVLELVHHQVVVAVLVALQHHRVFAEELHGAQQQVIEVHGVVLGQQLLVVPVDAGADFLEVIPSCLPGHRLRVLQHAFGLRYRRQNGTRRVALRIVTRPLQALLDGRHLVVVVEDRVVAGQTDELPLAPQQAGAEGVEGAHRQGVAMLPGQPDQPLPHLPGCLVGKGHRQDTVGADAVLLNQVGDAVGDDAGLAAARPGNDQQRPVGGLHRLALCRVKTLQ